MERPTLLLADDHVIVADGLRSLLKDEFDLVGTVTDGLSLVDAAQRLQADIKSDSISDEEREERIAEFIKTVRRTSEKQRVRRLKRVEKKAVAEVTETREHQEAEEALDRAERGQRPQG